jgi:fructose-1,6-bisphosphatase
MSKMNEYLKKILEEDQEENKEYGVRWSEFDRNDRIVKKEKIFKSEAAMQSFIKKLEAKDNFNKIEAYSM